MRQSESKTLESLTRLVLACCIFMVVLLNPEDCSGQMNCTCQLSDSANPPLSTETVSSSLGYVLILPGILGEKFWDRNIRNGIVRGGFQGDVEIYDWTRGALAMPLNVGGDSAQSLFLAKRITDFKAQFPDRALYLIGHSGGCRMAINVLEELSNSTGAVVDKAILLSPCMNANYDMRGALAGCRSEIYSFYSPFDVTIPLPLTLVHGVTKGQVAMSAAITGFRTPNPSSSNERSEKSAKLRQINYQRHMIGSGHAGGHFGWTQPAFVAGYIAPLLR